MTDREVNNYSQRIEALNQQIAQHPFAADSYYNEIGEIYGTLGQFGKAIAYFNQALQQNPLSGVYYSNLALALSNLGADEEALLNYTKAIAVSPNRMAYNNRACLYIDRKQYAEAIADCTAALQLNDSPREVCDKATIYATRAEAYMQMSDFRNALSDLNLGMEANPSDELIGFYDSSILKCNMRLGIKPCMK